MFGNIVNTVAIILGSLIGIVFKKRISTRMNDIMVEALALGVIVYGISEGIKMSNPIIVFVSLAVGALIGELVNIDDKLNKTGDLFQSKMKNTENVAQGFVTSSLVFCVGAMAIMGALQSGIEGKHDILVAKSFLDGTMSIIFASTMGFGVMLSSVSVFVYQGVIIVLSNLLKPLLSRAVINEMTAVGGILIFGIGINLLGMKKIKLANLLPALFIPIIIYLIYPY